MSFPAWITAVIAIFRAWLGFRAENQQKQEEHTGEVMQQNRDMAAELARDEAALKADANAPATKSEKLKALQEGTE